MNEPVRVWIIEDDKADAKNAWDVVSDIKLRHRTPAEIFWTESFDFPPNMRRAVDLNSQAAASSEYPDLVILDLCLLATLRADRFYDRLRAWETHKPDGRPAIIIFWSVFSGRTDARDFVKRAVDNDLRTVPVDSKQRELLQKKVSNVWQIIEEERAE